MTFSTTNPGASTPLREGGKCLRVPVEPARAGLQRLRAAYLKRRLALSESRAERLPQPMETKLLEAWRT